jgi:hypothetical protein
VKTKIKGISKMKVKTYTVFVEGSEVVDYQLSLSEAVDIRDHFYELDYNNIYIVENEDE